MSKTFASLDATAQAELIRSGQATPLELVDATLDAIDRTADLHAVIHRRDDAARREAAAARVGDQPFAGVPILVKDLDGYLAGEPYYAGSAHLRDAHYTADHTSWLFARLQAAGFVICGKTNTPELGLVPSAEPAALGPTHNPWDTTRTAGGSSGGSAAAVAAGITAVAHAGDGGGSIRIPASFCGLVGLKPSRGRVSNGPSETEPWAGLVARLVVSRTVRDTAAVLDCLAGAGPGDTEMAPPPARRFAAEVGADPGRLRIGVSTNAGDGTVTHPDVVTAVRAVADALAAAGHHVEDALDLPSDDPEFVTAMSTNFLTALPVWVARALDGFEEMTGTPPTAASVEAGTWSLAELGRAVPAPAFAAALDGLAMIRRRVCSWFDGPYDLLLTPTVPEVAPTLGQFGSTDDDPGAGLLRSAAIVPFTIPYNISGQPAISVPAAVSPDGLPIGVQLVAGWGHEDLLLQVASQLEQLLPWADRRPAVWAGWAG
jgi:amidase